jgi:hypothetical protein
MGTKTDTVLMIGAIMLLAVSIGCIAYGLDSSTVESEEEPQMSVPYITDEQGRIRIVATVTVTMNIHTGFEDEDEDEDTA